MKTKSIVNCSDIFLFLHYKSLLINTFSHCVKSPVFFLFGQQSLVYNNHSLQLLLLVIVVKRVYLDQLLYKIINNDSASHKYNPIIIYIHSKLWCKLIFSYPLYMYNQNEEKIHKMFIPVQGQIVFNSFQECFFSPATQVKLHWICQFITGLDQYAVVITRVTNSLYYTIHTCILTPHDIIIKNYTALSWVIFLYYTVYSYATYYMSS